MSNEALFKESYVDVSASLDGRVVVELEYPSKRLKFPVKNAKQLAATILEKALACERFLAAKERADNGEQHG